MTGEDRAGVRIVIPVKGAPLAKSRLQLDQRPALAHAFALDTIEAALGHAGAGQVLVVTADAAVRHDALELGAQVIEDTGSDLNSAVAQGLRAAEQESAGDPIAVLLGDLPALRPGDLRVAMAAAARHERAFVPDHTGIGTVLLYAADGRHEPAFGAGSAARHEGSGYSRLELSLPHLRRDVDVRDDLAAVIALGCGRHSAAVLADYPPALE